MATMTAKEHKAKVLVELLGDLISESEVEPSGDLTFNEVCEFIKDEVAKCEPAPGPDYRAMFQSLDRSNKS